MPQPSIRVLIALLLPLILAACKGEKNSPQQNLFHTEAQEESPQQLEIPHSDSSIPQQVIRHTGYVTSYDEAMRIPRWVAYELTPQEARARGKRDGEFQPDPNISGTSARSADYSRSGYGRGHMAPAGDMKWSIKAMHETFYLSNICPQNSNLNAGLWNDLETGLRQMSRQGKTLYIVCGPLLPDNPRRIGRSKVAVPEAFFKVVLRREGRGYEAIGYIFPNTRCQGSVNDYACSVDEVEARSGIDFFPLLPDDVEREAESKKNVSRWQWQTYGGKDSFRQRSNRRERRAETRK